MLRTIAAATLAAFMALGAATQTRAATGLESLSPDDAAAVQRAVRYLNDLSTLSARFVQISSNGTYAEGNVIIKRPGRLRLDRKSVV